MSSTVSQETATKSLLEVCHQAWITGLMRGFSGNASLRLEDGRIMITASGLPKGNLGENDLIVVDESGKILEGSRKPSIELGLHLSIYKTFPGCRAILHTHPVWLQTVAKLLAASEKTPSMLDLGLAESDYWRERLVIAPEQAPGSAALASAAVLALLAHWPQKNSLLLPAAVWLTGHGLCSLGENLHAALGISEQLEQLAHIHWAILAAKKD